MNIAAPRRDIKRWRVDLGGQYIIAIQNSGDASADNPWAQESTEVAAKTVFAQSYPALYDHLSRSERALQARADQGKFWWELRACAYYPEFDRPKVVWPDIAREIRFSYDTEGSFLGNTTYFTPSDKTWLVAALNSELIEFLLCQITNSLRGGFLRAFSQHMTRLPIVTPDAALQRRLEVFAEAGIAGAPVDSEELNDLVYDLYDLTRDDRALIKEWFERRSLAP